MIKRRVTDLQRQLMIEIWPCTNFQLGQRSTHQGGGEESPALPRFQRIVSRHMYQNGQSGLVLFHRSEVTEGSREGVPS